MYLPKKAHHARDNGRWVWLRGQHYERIADWYARAGKFTVAEMYRAAAAKCWKYLEREAV